MNSDERKKYEEIAEKIQNTKSIKKNAEFLKLAKQIKPLCRFKSEDSEMSCAPVRSELDVLGELYFIEPVRVFTEAYMWDPKPICKAPKLVKLAEIETLHSCNFPLFFKPSINEVLAVVPEEHKDKIVAFETFLESTDPDIVCVKTSQGRFHRATTRFYGLAEGEKVPEEIENQEVRCGGEIYSAKEIDEMQK